MKKAVLRERLWVKRKHIKQSTLDRLFTHEIHPDPGRCARCDDSLCHLCRYRPYHYENYIIDGDLVGLPWGDLKKVRRFLHLNSLQVKDLRSSPKLSHQVRFTGELRAYQRVAVRRWLKHKLGLIQAPARSGKTVIAVYLTAKLGIRTLVIAHREDLLRQFRDAFYDFTDLAEVERYVGRPLLVLATKKNYKADITLATFQFLIKGNRLEELLKHFGLVIVDECHHVPATCFSKVVNSLAARHRLGLTATPERKDKLHVVMFDIMGPVVAKVKPPSLKVKVKVIKTGYKVPPFKMWNAFLNRLAKNQGRNSLIVKYIQKDLQQGRSILIVLWRRFHVEELSKRLSKLQIPFVTLYGKINAKKREENLNLLRRGEIRVTLATRNVVQEGIDCPRWDTLYFVTPSANPAGIYQEMSRIRTPSPDKRPPLIRYFLDDCSAAHACYNKAKAEFLKEKFIVQGEDDVSFTESRRLQIYHRY